MLAELCLHPPPRPREMGLSLPHLIYSGVELLF